MKLLATLIAGLLLTAVTSFAQVDASLETGYFSKRVELGTVTDQVGSYYANVGLSYDGFSLNIDPSAHSDVKFTKLVRTDITAGYTLQTSIASLEVGDDYISLNQPAKLDYAGHNRPFTTITSGPVSVTVLYDIESRIANGQATIKQAFPLAGDVKIAPEAFVGYTNTADLLPKTLKAVSYTNAYYGGGAELNCKFVFAGADYLHQNWLGKNTVVWDAGLRARF